MTYNELNNLRVRFFNLLESEMGNVKPLLTEGVECPKGVNSIECTNVAIYNSTGSGGKLVFGYQNADNSKGYVEAKYIFPEKDHKLVLNFDQSSYKKQFPQVVDNTLFSKGSSFKLSIPNFIQNPQPAKQTSIQDKYGKIQPAQSDATSTKTWKTQHGDKSPTDVADEIKQAKIKKEKEAIDDRGGDLSTLQKSVGWIGLGFNLLAGILRGPKGWAALAIGLATDLIGYYDLTQRTDSVYERGLYLAFMILYLDDVKFLLKGSSFTEDGLRELINLIKTNGITDKIRQMPIYKWCINVLSTNSTARNTLDAAMQAFLKRTLVGRITEAITNQSLPYILAYLRRLSPANTVVGRWLWSNKLSLTAGVYSVVGAYVTFDQLYLAFYHPECLDEKEGDCKNAELKKLSEREMNGLRTIIRDYVTGGEISKEVKEYIIKQLIPKFSDYELLVLKDEEKAFNEQKDTYQEISNEAAKIDEQIFRLYGNLKYYNKPEGERNPEDISQNIKDIAIDVYESIVGVGTDIRLLTDSLRKLVNFTEFNLMNIYLYHKYGENFFDLANSFLELELDQKKRIAIVFRVRRIPVKLNENGKFILDETIKKELEKK